MIAAKRPVPSTIQNARRLLRFLSRKRETISPLLILTHDYPDPDSLASAFGLQTLAEKVGIQSRIVYGGVIGRTENREMVNILKIPIRKFKPIDLKKYTHVALMDTQPLFENNAFPKNRQATIVIDQHPSLVKPSAELPIVDTECGATSVIIAQALLLLKKEIPTRVATALAYGILSDTANLYRAGRLDIVQAYLDLLPYCDLRALGRIQHPERSKKFFCSLAKGIQKSMACRGVIVSHLGFVESPDLVAQVADFLLSYKPVQWSVSTGRYNGKLHVSIRTASNAEASSVLRDAFLNREEAGGHDSIAGGSFKVGKNPSEESWKKAEKEFIMRLKKRLRIPQKAEFYSPFRY